MSSLPKSSTLLLVASLALAASAYGQSAGGLALLQPKEKSTLETFPLPSLEQDDLAEAVIRGTLDVPAAGGQGEGAEVSSFMPKEPSSVEEYSDVHQYRTPTTFNIYPTPVPTGSRTYSRDYR